MPTPDPAIQTTAPDRSPWLVFSGVLTLGIVVLGLQVGPGGTIPTAGDLLRLLGAVGLAGAWLLAALGLGTALQRIGPATTTDFGRSLGGRWALGVAILLWLDLVLGSIGLLGRDHRLLGILVLALPVLALPVLAGSTRSITGPDAPSRADPTEDRPASSGWWLLVPIAPPLAVLLVAAASVPGWLWATEFGGFDALSYHLQVPREWWYAGGIVELPHNAYAYLPGAVSAAFLHLMTIVGDPQAAAIACQMLVAGATIVAMLATADLVRALLPAGTPTTTTRSTALLGGLALIATPWVVVVGSLAYDESFVLLLTAVAVAIVLGLARPSTSPPSWTSLLRTGVVLGLLLGGAVVAKASSTVLVVLPVAIGAAIAVPPRRWWPLVLGTAIGGVLVCLPWLIRTAAWTGNPVFPLATGLFGAADWSSAQAARFDAAHASPGPLRGLAALGREFLLDDLLGPLPAGEPRRPQWWWLPGLGLLSAAVLLGRRGGASGDRRRVVVVVAVLVAMLLAWACLTHAKARFLLPTAPLLAACVGVLLAPLFRHRQPARLVLVLAWLAGFGPVIHLLGERDGAPAWGVTAQAAFDGRLEARLLAEADPAIDPETEATLRRNASLAFVLRSLPADARTLLVGVATPFHLPMRSDDRDVDRLAYTTVWTRGPLELAFQTLPEGPPTDADLDPIVTGLRDQGFTHVVVAPTMLEVWSRSGWIDPVLTPARLAALTAHPRTTIAHRFPDGGVLLALEPPR